jgi:hypothetical protein
MRSDNCQPFPLGFDVSITGFGVSITDFNDNLTGFQVTSRIFSLFVILSMIAAAVAIRLVVL